MFVVHVLYPSNAKLDTQYPLERRSPLVERLWKTFGMLGVSATSVSCASSGKAALKPAYFGPFDSSTSFKNAMAEASASVMEDIPRFFNTPPTILFGDLIGGIKLIHLRRESINRILVSVRGASGLRLLWLSPCELHLGSFRHGERSDHLRASDWSGNDRGWRLYSR
jgi:hypothetical protein